MKIIFTLAALGTVAGAITGHYLGVIAGSESKALYSIMFGMFGTSVGAKCGYLIDTRRRNNEINKLVLRALKNKLN